MKYRSPTFGTNYRQSQEWITVNHTVRMAPKRRKIKCQDAKKIYVFVDVRYIREFVMNQIANATIENTPKI